MMSIKVIFKESFINYVTLLEKGEGRQNKENGVEDLVK